MHSAGLCGFNLGDLHLASCDFEGTLAKGDVLIIAGDDCRARSG